MVEEEESKPSECTNYALLFRFVSQRTPSCAEFALVVLGSLVVGEGCIVVLPTHIANAHTHTHTHSAKLKQLNSETQ